MKIRPLQTEDHKYVLALNHESVHFLSPLDLARLQHLVHESALHLVVENNGVVIGFLLAFTQGADYDSLNYSWFAERYSEFLYIDRVVVSQQVQSKGAGSALYQAVFNYAQEQGIAMVCCEFDIDPPNPVSEQFHKKLGFKELGKQLLGNGKKWVSMQAFIV
jgi:predicted GNAT superfamily acetyltransferase